MSILSVERIGGLAGFGGARARIRSLGQLDTEQLSAADRKVVDALFQPRKKAEKSSVRDGFRFRLTRTTERGDETVEIAEKLVPALVAQCVKDELT